MSIHLPFEEDLDLVEDLLDNLRDFGPRERDADDLTFGVEDEDNAGVIGDDEGLAAAERERAGEGRAVDLDFCHGVLPFLGERLR